MSNQLGRTCDQDLAAVPPTAADALSGDHAALARALTVLEAGRSPELAQALLEAVPAVPVWASPARAVP
jgi:methylmalonyl-CoA mutase